MNAAPVLSPTSPQRDAHSKALALNLAHDIYGTLAEIGAGQEVARWFYCVGGASGTVAKTMSAYDKEVSDDIYGAGTRYVSKERLGAMLDWEYRLLLQRLNAARGEHTRFFAFANTVAARNYHGTNEQHGWLGIRFQAEPQSEPSEVLLHINLADSTAQLQQQAIGVLGVNLIYATFHQRSDSGTFLAGLFDELSMNRIEIDVLKLNGPAFSGQDEREWCLALLCRSMAHGIVFDSSGAVVEPSSVLRKRPLLVRRGTFQNPERLSPDLLPSACSRLRTEGIALEREPVSLLEFTIRHINRVESTSVAEMLTCLRNEIPHHPVIVTNYPETYQLTRYLRRHSTEPLRLVLSVAALAEIMHEAFYKNLPGRLLEGLGRLLATNVTIYVAPMPRPEFVAALGNAAGALGIEQSGDGAVSLEDLSPLPPGRYLFKYLRASGRFVAL